MRCWRIDLQRKFSLYVAGELPINSIKAVENHLLDCNWCRARVARIRAGHQLAEQMPGFAPERDPWAQIEAAVSREQSRFSAPPAIRRAEQFISPRFAVTLIAAIAVAIAALVITTRQTTVVNNFTEDEFDFGEFHPVAIADIETNTEPHIVAEGYVSEVRIDSEDGDLLFKLVEDVRQSRPFIVCEILNTKKIKPPHVGSRVRVYGVSRYDGKANHQWYEVHPVLNIEEVKY